MIMLILYIYDCSKAFDQLDFIDTPKAHVDYRPSKGCSVDFSRTPFYLASWASDRKPLLFGNFSYHSFTKFDIHCS